MPRRRTGLFSPPRRARRTSLFGSPPKRRRSSGRRRNSDHGDAALSVILVFVQAFISLLSLAFSALFAGRDKQRLRTLQVSDVDNMSGPEFERYVAALFEHYGFAARVTKGSGDLGVDIIAKRGDLRYAVQTKRYASPVPRTAVSDAVAGMDHYGCNAAMVVTNSWFSDGAKELAWSTGCVLVDRDALAVWIIAFQGADHATFRSRLNQ
jgi:restriction system protein